MRWIFKLCQHPELISSQDPALIIINEITSNRETGAGRSDIIMKSLQPFERPHIIIEFKHGESLKHHAEAALEQILEKKYHTGLLGQILCIGIAHYKKEVELISREIEIF